MPAARGSVIAAVAEVIRTRRGTVWIGVDGYGATGKTTFAAELAATAPGAVVVHVDDFSGPRIAEWDWPRFTGQVVTPLLAGRRARYQRWDWDTDCGAEWHIIDPGSAVIVEGVSAIRREVRVPWALTVWLQAPREVRLARARQRDGPGMLRRWLEDWMPSEEAYAAREDPATRADFVVDTADDGE